MVSQASSPRILLIGGSGFLSGTLAREAVERGYRVWAITRGERPVPPGVIGLVADRHDEAAFVRAVEQANTEWDMVVDCIGFDPADARQDVAVLRDRARHLVFVSTDFVYDPARRRFPQPEESEHYLSEGYGGKKRQCELELINGDTGNMVWTIVRPGHIYGPGSRLGCLPMHGRDPNLIERLRAGEPLQLVGGGHFLQQPIFAPDLARLILSLHGNARTYGEIFCAAGPEIVESREYYRVIAEILGVELRISEVPVGAYLAQHPESAPFLCHRFYALDRLRASGASVPATPLVEGLRTHVASLLT